MWPVFLINVSSKFPVVLSSFYVDYLISEIMGKRVSWFVAAVGNKMS